jgi:thiol-disulfide isomerase/thioredoxin
MSFLKSCFTIVLVATLHACTGEAVRQRVAEEVPASETAAAPSQPSLETLPSFSIVDAGGRIQNLQSYRGKKLFVNLWATWCPPCRAEMPSIEKLYEAAHKENTQFVLLSLDNDFETAKKYIQANGLKLPIYFPAGDLPELFAVNGIPTTFIFNEAGELIERREGSENYDTPAYRKLFEATN